MRTNKLSSISMIGVMLFHTSAFAIQQNTSELNVSGSTQMQSIKADTVTGGLDFTSITTSAITGYFNQQTSPDYWPEAAVVIAVSAGLQYTIDTQTDSVSDLKVVPYFSGTETGIAISFTFQ